jgi:hypothetical protein
VLQGGFPHAVLSYGFGATQGTDLERFGTTAVTQNWSAMVASLLRAWVTVSSSSDGSTATGRAPMGVVGHDEASLAVGLAATSG